MSLTKESLSTKLVRVSLDYLIKFKSGYRPIFLYLFFLKSINYIIYFPKQQQHLRILARLRE